MDTEILRTSEASRCLHISEWTLRRLAKAGQMSFIRTGGNNSAYRFLRPDLDAFIGAHRVPARRMAKRAAGRKGGGYPGREVCGFRSERGLWATRPEKAVRNSG